MKRTLLVTNDFPPVVGGIQTYLEEYCRRLPAEDLVVLASTPPEGTAAALEYDRAVPYEVHRNPTHMLLPVPAVRDQMQEIIETRDIHTVWFGAAAPLGLLAPAARAAGAHNIIATTHGHEVGWSMIPGARQALRKIFRDADVVSYISQYTLRRLSGVLPRGKATVQLPSGIDVERFAPDAVGRTQLRERYGIGEVPTVCCVSRLVRRKGQDALIRIWPQVVRAIPNARLVIVGWGPLAKTLGQMRRESPVRESIILTGKVPFAELPAHVAMADVFAMPCRTRGKGLDVEGLGIVFLEASAAGVPVIAGDSGGAPETVIEGVTGTVVNGRDDRALTQAIIDLLSDPVKARTMGRAGRNEMIAHWQWPALIEKLTGAINGEIPA